MKRAIAIALLATAGCTTVAPVKIGRDSYLIEGGIGLAGAPPSMMIQKANELCASQGKETVVTEIAPWIPGQRPPHVQFICTNNPTPTMLRPDRGVTQ